MRQFDEAPQELLHVDLSSHAPNFDAYNFFAEIIVVETGAYTNNHSTSFGLRFSNWAGMSQTPSKQTFRRSKPPLWLGHLSDSHIGVPERNRFALKGRSTLCQAGAGTVKSA